MVQIRDVNNASKYAEHFAETYKQLNKSFSFGFLHGLSATTVNVSIQADKSVTEALHEDYLAIANDFMRK